MPPARAGGIASFCRSDRPTGPPYGPLLSITFGPSDRTRLLRRRGPPSRSLHNQRAFHSGHAMAWDRAVELVRAWFERPAKRFAFALERRRGANHRVRGGFDGPVV